MAKKTNYTEDTLLKMGLLKDDKGNFYRPKTTQQPREKLTIQRRQVNVENPIVDLGREFVYGEINPCEHFEKDHIDEVRKIEELSVVWAGKDISLNAWYSSKHWTHRNKQKQEWHEFFKQSIVQPYPFFEKYSVTLEYNSRLDPSNTITMIKLFEDTLTELGIITDDTLKYCIGVHLIPKLEMKKKSYRITIKKA